MHGFRLLGQGAVQRGSRLDIFGRRSLGCIRCAPSERYKDFLPVFPYKKLSLLEKRKMFLTELRKEGRDSASEDAALLAEFL